MRVFALCLALAMAIVAGGCVGTSPGSRGMTGSTDAGDGGDGGAY